MPYTMPLGDVKDAKYTIPTGKLNAQFMRIAGAIVGMEHAAKKTIIWSRCIAVISSAAGHERELSCDDGIPFRV